MNLHEQLGALEMGVDQLIQAVVATQAENIPETRNQAERSDARPNMPCRTSDLKRSKFKPEPRPRRRRSRRANRLRTRGSADAGNQPPARRTKSP